MYLYYYLLYELSADFEPRTEAMQFFPRLYCDDIAALSDSFLGLNPVELEIGCLNSALFWLHKLCNNWTRQVGKPIFSMLTA